jgi:hypothetical protein
MNSIKALCMSVALLTTLPALAQTTKFDGNYAGVSGKTLGGTVNCPPVQTPAPLTVANGTAQSQGGGSFQGTVGADGAVVLHDKGNNRYQGTIDGTGLLKVGGGTPRCNFEFVWQKR